MALTINIDHALSAQANIVKLLNLAAAQGVTVVEADFTFSVAADTPDSDDRNTLLTAVGGAGRWDGKTIVFKYRRATPEVGVPTTDLGTVTESDIGQKISDATGLALSDFTGWPTAPYNKEICHGVDDLT